jgi:FkbM family methyltransferase
MRCAFPLFTLLQNTFFLVGSVAADRRPPYLSLKRWSSEDGFVDAAAYLNVTISRPIYMTRSESLVETLRYVAHHEQFIIHTITRALEAECDGNNMFVDSGANDGVWSMLAASFGCKVIAVEPQSHCVELLHVALRKNHLANNVRVINALVGLNSSSTPMQVPEDQCHGTAQFIAKHNAVSDATGPGRRFRKQADTLARKSNAVPFVRMDEMVRNTVALWHLDTEGAEPIALQSASLAFQKRQIKVCTSSMLLEMK